MLKKFLASVGALALAVGLVAFVASPASAHDHTVSADCSAGVHVDLENYQGATNDQGAPATNHVTITQDGKVTFDTDFSSQLIQTFAWAAAAGSHSWRVVVTASDDSSYSFDTGSLAVLNCDATAAPAAVTTSNAVCVGSDVGAGGYVIPSTPGVHYEKLAGANWATIASGPYSLAVGSTVSIRAVAEAGYRLAGKSEWDNLSVSGPSNCASAVCIPNSAVSYTYDPATNSGQITVADVKNSTGSLCRPFYVTATSWKYTKAAQWPQVRDVVQKLPQITKPGVYSYAATVTCGQGDIYASFGSQPDPTPTLTAPQTPFTEHFLYGMGFTGPSPTSMHQPTACFTAPPVCIPNSAVSYTYDGATNSGKITVTDVANSAGVLCNPFYVTATSWKYVKTATWPQVRDVVQKLPQITKPGVYPYAAAVTCGQGDIYASFTAQPDPTPTLAGPNNPFTEHFLHQMGFSGPFPTYVQQPTSCLSPATSGSVVFANQVCDTAHPGQAFAGSFTITPGLHVTYTASISSVAGGAVKPVAAGTTQVAPGDIVTINVVSDAGYSLSSPVDPSKWTFHYLADQGCLADSNAVKPTFASQSCVPESTVAEDASITIPTTVGVRYLIDGDATDAGVVVLKPGTYQVTAKATAGYALYNAAENPNDPTAYPTGGWSITLTAADACGGLPTDSVQPSNVTSTAAVCTVSGSQLGTITVGQVGAVDFTPYVQYSINGVAVNVITSSVVPGTYTVTAVAKSPNDSLEAGPHVLPDGTASWTVTIVAPAQLCGDLPTHPLVDPTATQVQLQCFSGGSYTLGNDLNDPAAIIWTVNGSTVAQGTYKIAAAGTVTVHAEANGPTYGLEQGATQDWTFTFTAPANCDLKTLALTGSTPIGWIVLGYLLLISGLVLVAIRHLRRRSSTQE